MTAQQIISDLENYMSTPYSGWYVGITNDTVRRFEEHSVQMDKQHYWIRRDADSHTIARQVEKYFLDKGAKGGPGGGDEDSIWIYAYKITSSTNP